MPKPNSVFLLANLQHLQVASNFLKNHKSVDQVSFFMGYILIWSSRWHPTPVLLPGKSHGWRSLVGCSLWGRQESDTTERLHFHFSLSCIGEGNGKPTPVFLSGESQGRGSLVGCRLWGAWWAAVYGVAQSGTQLKRLSSSSKLYTECQELGFEYSVYILALTIELTP